MYKKILKHTTPIIIVRSFVNSLVVLLDNYKQKRRGFNYFINLFIIRFIYGLTFFRKFIKEKINFKNTENIYSHNKENLNATLKSLMENGFAGEFLLLNEYKDTIKNELIKNTTENSIVYLNGDFKKENIKFEDLNQAIEYTKKNKIYIMKSSIDIKNSDKLKKIITNDYFVQLAKTYLNNDTISINSSIFISNAIKNNNDKLENLSAQKYHFDIDYKKFIKLIVYFTDTFDLDDGAHIFIPKTHKFKFNKHMITNRYNNNDIEETYKTKKIFYGPSGTFFWVDTFGFHKGSPIKNNNRVAAFIEYGHGHFKLTEDTIFL